MPTCRVAICALTMVSAQEKSRVIVCTTLEKGCIAFSRARMERAYGTCAMQLENTYICTYIYISIYI